MADANRAFGSFIGTCPVCGQVLSGGHEYWALATAKPSSPLFRRVTQQIEAHAWTLANAYEWDATSDSVQFTVIKCPTSADLGFVTTFHGADLYSGSYVESRQIIQEPDATALATLAGDQWARF